MSELLYLRLRPRRPLARESGAEHQFGLFVDSQGSQLGFFTILDAEI